jgi:hypothetical protein
MTVTITDGRAMQSGQRPAAELEWRYQALRQPSVACCHAANSWTTAIASHNDRRFAGDDVGLLRVRKCANMRTVTPGEDLLVTEQLRLHTRDVWFSARLYLW